MAKPRAKRKKIDDLRNEIAQHQNTIRLLNNGARLQALTTKVHFSEADVTLKEQREIAIRTYANAIYHRNQKRPHRKEYVIIDDAMNEVEVARKGKRSGRLVFELELNTARANYDTTLPDWRLKDSTFKETVIYTGRPRLSAAATLEGFQPRSPLEFIGNRTGSAFIQRTQSPKNWTDD